MSPLASQLAEARAPEVIDLERVERLRAAIATGAFSIDADIIAGRMLAEES